MEDPDSKNSEGVLLAAKIRASEETLSKASSKPSLVLPLVVLLGIFMFAIADILLRKPSGYGGIRDLWFVILFFLVGTMNQMNRTTNNRIDALLKYLKDQGIMEKKMPRDR